MWRGPCGELQCSLHMPVIFSESAAHSEASDAASVVQLAAKRACTSNSRMPNETAAREDWSQRVDLWQRREDWVSQLSSVSSARRRRQPRCWPRRWPAAALGGFGAATTLPRLPLHH